MSRKDRVYWICRCACGREKSVLAKHLRMGQVTSCRCSLSLPGKESKSWKGYDDISGKYFNQIKRNAGLRGFDFNLSIKEAWEVWLSQKGLCAVSGQPIILGTGSKQTASIDRIDSTKGYSKDNIQWTHKDINMIKSNYSMQEFFEMCKAVVEYNKL